MLSVFFLICCSFVCSCVFFFLFLVCFSFNSILFILFARIRNCISIFLARNRTGKFLRARFFFFLFFSDDLCTRFSSFQFRNLQSDLRIQTKTAEKTTVAIFPNLFNDWQKWSALNRLLLEQTMHHIVRCANGKTFLALSLAHSIYRSKVNTKCGS